MTTSTPERPGEWTGSTTAQAAQVLTLAFPFRHVSVTGTLRAPFRMRSAGDAEVLVASVRLDCSWAMESYAEPGYVMLWATRGEATASIVGEAPLRLTPTPTMVSAGKPFLLRGRGSTVNMVFFEADRFESVASNYLKIRIGPVRFTGQPSPEQMVALNHTLDRCAPELLNPDTATKFRAMWNRDLSIAAVTAFQATPERIADGAEPLGVFARGQVFIEQNLHLALTISEIAAGVAVTERQLQVAFHRKGDTTPLAYVRQVRLYRVRRDLRDAGPHAVIADIAAQWGFTHYGRFEAAYVNEFGRLPVVG